MKNNWLDDFLKWLDTFLNFEKLPQKNMFWLSTMEFLCEQFDNPQFAIPSWHIAGSKGKGSVCAMIASILTQAGFRTGVYSSPHIEDFRERIKLNDNFFSQEIYLNSANELCTKFEKINDKIPQDRSVTWFELVTLYAFLCFKNANLSQAVFEVGLGGRLDATNVIKPQICIINTIELEHTDFLGDTIEKIATEKAGIIKPRIPVLIAEQNLDAQKVFEKTAKEKNAQLYYAPQLLKTLDYSFDCNTKTMNVEFDSNLFSRSIQFKLKMPGLIQAKNAFLAAAAIKLVYPEISEKQIEEGLEQSFLPARFEVIKNPFNKKCDLIIDGAHTINSIKLTLETLNQFYCKEKTQLLFACAADKNVEQIANTFSNNFKFDKIYLTKPGSTKNSSPIKMQNAFSKSGFTFYYHENYSYQIESAIKNSANENSHLLIVGSFYLASEVKKILNKI